MSIFKKKSIIFLVLFLFALAWRLPGISFHPLWFDETSTALIVSQPFHKIIKAINTFEATPPFFFLSEKAFIDGFHLALSEKSLRFLPVIFGALSCVLYFFLFKEISDKKIGYYIFALMASANFHIETSQDARSYSLLILLALSTIFFTLQWWKRPDFKRSLALPFSVGLIVQAHYYAVIWILALCLAVFLTKQKNKQLRNYLLLVGLSGCFSLMPLLPLFLTHIHYEVSPLKCYLMQKWLPGLLYSPVKVLVGAYLFKISSLRDISLVELLGIVPVLLLLLIALLSFYRRLRRRDVSEPEMIITFSLFIAFSFHGLIGWKVPTIHPQYMEHFLLLLFGCIMLNLPSRYAMRFFAFALLLFFNIIANINYYTSRKPYYEPWKKIAAAVDSCIVADKEGEKPIIGDFTSILPLAYYLKNKTTVFYQSYSPFFPVSENNYARLNAFGSVMYTDLFHFNYYPLVQRLSFIEIMKSTKCGFFIERKSRPLETVHRRLNDTYQGAVDFSLCRIFDSNQGPIAIVRWKYVGEK